MEMILQILYFMKMRLMNLKKFYVKTYLKIQLQAQVKKFPKKNKFRCNNRIIKKIKYIKKKYK